MSNIPASRCLPLPANLLWAVLAVVHESWRFDSSNSLVTHIIYNARSKGSSSRISASCIANPGGCAEAATEHFSYGLSCLLTVKAAYQPLLAPAVNPARARSYSTSLKFIASLDLLLPSSILCPSYAGIDAYANRLQLPLESQGS